jgi:surface protein
MGYMFSRCSSVTSLDVSKFNTTKVTDMAGMFYHCSGLTTIYSNDGWNCESSNNMFKECTFLKGAIIYDSSKTDITYANPTTGYFTAFTLGDADGDGEITDKDVKAVEDNIMGYTPDNFIPSAADSNGDGVVNVADIVDINNKKK